MEEILKTIGTSIASQGPLVAYMFWQLMQYKKDIDAKDKRIDDLIDNLLEMTKEGTATISKNNDAISALPGAFYALKGSVDAIKK